MNRQELISDILRCAKNACADPCDKRSLRAINFVARLAGNFDAIGDIATANAIFAIIADPDATVSDCASPLPTIPGAGHPVNMEPQAWLDKNSRIINPSAPQSGEPYARCAHEEQQTPEVPA